MSSVILFQNNKIEITFYQIGYTNSSCNLIAFLFKSCILKFGIRFKQIGLKANMVFSNLVFLCVFLPLTIILYYVVPKPLKNYLLLTASIIFYSWGEPQYIFLMMLSIIMNYFFGLGVDKYRDKLSAKRTILFLTVVANLLILGYYKYSNFLIDNLNSLFNWQIELEPLSLPIGISFYTFQALSYVIDVSRRDGAVQRNPFDLALYIALFPQLVAGPIVRYSTVADQINSRVHSVSLFYEGLIDFIVGLGKKVIIANQMAIVADQIFSKNTGDMSTSIAWVGIIAYSLQIYFDFSGYSNMAIGLGKMFGFTFPQNFNYPYISRSVSEFWRRWHITLGSWFRDYVYIPLGGNRGSKWMLYRNLFIVWFLTGLWHGASWNFIVWGLFYGFLIAFERAGLGNALTRSPKVVQHLYVILAFMIGWVFFRSETLTYAVDYLKVLFGFGAGFWSKDVVFYLQQYWIEFVIALIGVTPVMKNLFSKANDTFKTMAGPIFCFVILLYCVGSLATSSYNPFIYFRF